MNRPTKNRTRGPQKRALPAKPTPAHGSLMQSFDERATTNAGTFERRAVGQDGDGHVVGWQKSVSGT